MEELETPSGRPAPEVLNLNAELLSCAESGRGTITPSPAARPPPRSGRGFPTVSTCLGPLSGKGVVVWGGPPRHGSPWPVALLAYGFVARVAAGPTFSPLAQFVTRVLTPRLAPGAPSVAGTPKRFAQGIGATLSVGAVAAHALGRPGVATALVAMLVGAAGLEAGAGYCLGCRIYGLLAKAGIVAPEACPECADITRDGAA